MSSNTNQHLMLVHQSLAEHGDQLRRVRTQILKLSRANLALKLGVGEMTIVRLESGHPGTNQMLPFQIYALAGLLPAMMQNSEMIIGKSIMQARQNELHIHPIERKPSQNGDIELPDMEF